MTSCSGENPGRCRVKACASRPSGVLLMKRSKSVMLASGSKAGGGSARIVSRSLAQLLVHPPARAAAQEVGARDIVPQGEALGMLETQSASESGSEVPVQGNLLAGGRP
jgi:hypothetical protein